MPTRQQKLEALLKLAADETLTPQARSEANAEANRLRALIRKKRPSPSTRA